MLRKMFGPTLENGEWRRRHNKEIRDAQMDRAVIALGKAGRVRWAGHVMRLGKGTILNVVIIGKPEERRPIGRPRWWDVNRKNINRIGAIEEEEEDRESWKRVSVWLRPLYGTDGHGSE